MKNSDKVIIGLLLLIGFGGYFYYQSIQQKRAETEASIARDQRNWRKNVDNCIQAGKDQSYCECSITRIQESGSTAVLEEMSRVELDAISDEASRYCREKRIKTELAYFKDEIRQQCKQESLSDRGCDCLIVEVDKFVSQNINRDLTDKALVRELNTLGSSKEFQRCFYIR